MTSEERLIVKLRGHIGSSSSMYRKYYWANELWGHESNTILLIEELVEDKWVIKYEAETLV